MEAIGFDAVPQLCCEKAMDDFVNAERRPEKCRRTIANIHFGNVDLRKSLLSLIDHIDDDLIQRLSSTDTVVSVAPHACQNSAVISAIQPTSSFLLALTPIRSHHDVLRSTTLSPMQWAKQRRIYVLH